MSVRSVRVQAGKIYVETKYDPNTIKLMKELGGRWDPEARAWVFPEEAARRLSEKLGIKVPERGQVVYLRRRGKRSVVAWLPSGEVLVVSLTELCRLLTGQREYARARLLPPREE